MKSRYNPFNDPLSVATYFNTSVKQKPSATPIEAPKIDHNNHWDTTPDAVQGWIDSNKPFEPKYHSGDYVHMAGYHSQVGKVITPLPDDTSGKYHVRVRQNPDNIEYGFDFTEDQLTPATREEWDEYQDIVRMEDKAAKDQKQRTDEYAQQQAIDKYEHGESGTPPDQEIPPATTPMSDAEQLRLGLLDLIEEHKEEEDISDIISPEELEAAKNAKTGFGDVTVGAKVRMEHYGEYYVGKIVKAKIGKNMFIVEDDTGRHKVHLDDVLAKGGPRLVIDGVVQETPNVGDYMSSDMTSPEPVADRDIAKEYDYVTNVMGKSHEEAIEIIKGEYPGQDKTINDWSDRKNIQLSEARQQQQAFEGMGLNLVNPDEFDPSADPLAGQELDEDVYPNLHMTTNDWGNDVSPERDAQITRQLAYNARSKAGVSKEENDWIREAEAEEWYEQNNMEMPDDWVTPIQDAPQDNNDQGDKDEL